MPRPLTVATTLALAAFFCSCRPHPTTVGRYQAGQVWYYKTRAGEEKSRLTVEQVTRNRDGVEAVFVAVSNLRVVTNLGTEIHSFSSFPFTRQALDGSVTELVQAHGNPPPNPNGDLLGPPAAEWRKGNGKPIEISVADFIRTFVEAKETSPRYDTPLNPPIPNGKVQSVYR